MKFTESQILIIKLLKTYKPTTLAGISKKLGFPKSSLLYQLEPLVEQKILIKSEISPKKITYQLASLEEMNSLIGKEKFEMEFLLTNKEIKGIEAYKDLLTLVANGDSDVIGYANLERKLIPELETFIERFRDKMARSGRKDRFTVTNYPHNIALMKDHFRKKEWVGTFLGRIVPKEIMDVNCDIYVWDGTVGICSFEDNGFKVQIYNDRVTFNVFKSLLWFLWNQSALD
jgi:hypothetical protein